MRKNILFLGVIFLIAAFVLFGVSDEVMQILYRADPTEWAGYENPQNHDLLMLSGICFLASIVLGTIGIITIVYGAGAKRKSQETKQVLNNKSAES